MHNCIVWILSLNSDRKEISEGWPSLGTRFLEGGITSDRFWFMNWVLIGIKNNLRKDGAQNDQGLIQDGEEIGLIVTIYILGEWERMGSKVGCFR